ncbi:MAG: GlxA family transcriptional regulator [Geminicoccaceae bacterium]|nr:GlxA family transcriptional regulator [Geminicoccaceae bacterium]MCB9942893.1 GlxA family transcriptional regulator [Geminicoccaceae bacterium]
MNRDDDAGAWSGGAEAENGGAAYRKSAAQDGPVAAVEPFNVLFYLVEGFSMMALSSAIEPLRAANRLTGNGRYSWSLAAERMGNVLASNGIAIGAHHGLDNAPRADLTVVVASLFDESGQSPRLFSWLRRLRAEGRMIGAISNGTLLLARAGVLGNRRVTIHWEMTRLLEESFHELDVSREIYCWDRGIVTAAGGAAAMDMMLAVIMDLDGEDVAIDVAEQFLHGPIRPPSHEQLLDLRWRFRITDRRLLMAIQIMRANISDPQRIPAIAAHVGISERQFERLFVTELGKLPSDFYMDLRLRSARGMLIGSTEPLESIAQTCGFSSLGHFSRAFKAHFGESPSVARRHRSRSHGGFVQEDGGR